MLGEIFEMCYWLNDEKVMYNVRQNNEDFVYRLCKDSILKSKDGKIYADYHYVRMEYVVTPV